jgi:O-antigen ligase
MGSVLDWRVDVSAHSRLDGLRNGIEMLIRRPILGVGVGCYGLAREAWFGWGLWAHNLYGELAGELGIAGVLAWGSLMVLCFREIRQLRTELATDESDRGNLLRAVLDACWASLAVRLVLGMSSHSLSAFIWYMVAGVLVGVRRVVAASAEPVVEHGGGGAFPRVAYGGNTSGPRPVTENRRRMEHGRA